jgi:hypothetical protein
MRNAAAAEAHRPVAGLSPGHAQLTIRAKSRTAPLICHVVSQTGESLLGRVAATAVP